MCRVFPALPHWFGAADAWHWHPHRGRCAVPADEMAHGRRPHCRGNRPAEIVLLGGETMKVVVWKSPRYLNGLLRKLFGFGKDETE